MDTIFRCSSAHFEFLKTQDEPVLLHILTKKGKGYEPAIKQPDKFHGLGKYKIESGETAPAPTPTYSEIIGKTLAKFADTNQKIVAITAAMPSGTGLGISPRRIPTVISTSASPKSTRRFLRAGWRRKA